MLHSSYSKYIMESIVTIRNDRYVIPVKEEYRSLVKGFVHDISASGSTLFIEPMQVFELNNKIHSLKIEENIEIENILENLSKNLIPYISELKNPSYVPVISGYIEGIFFCHLTHRGVSHKTELPGRYSIKTEKQPEVLSGPGISTS